MLLILRPAGDPRAQRFDFGGRERLVRIGRRHPHVGVVRFNAFDEHAVFKIARRDCLIAAEVGRRAVERIEPQIGLARFVVGPMASEAFRRQNRPHVAVERDLRLVGQRRRSECAEEQVARNNSRQFHAIHCTLLQPTLD